MVDIPISTSTTLATREELFSASEQLALAGFLAGYSGLTRDAYTLDLRQYVAWCTEHHLAVFRARRADISPAAHVRRPRLDYESHATGLDGNEVGAMLVAAGLAGARDHALISLLALNGLRVSEALGADIEDLGWSGGTARSRSCAKAARS